MEDAVEAVEYLVVVGYGDNASCSGNLAREVHDDAGALGTKRRRRFVGEDDAMATRCASPPVRFAGIEDMR